MVTVATLNWLCQNGRNVSKTPNETKVMVVNPH